MTTLSHLGANSDGTHITSSQNQKEVRSNALDDLLANAMNASTTIPCNAGGTVSVSAENFTENFLLVLTGDSGSPLEPAADFVLQIPATKRTFAVANTTGFAALVDASGSPSTAVSIASGDTIFLHSDGETVRSLGGGGAAASGNTWLGFDFDSTPTASTVIRRIPIMEDVVLPADLSGFYSLLVTAPDTTYDIDVTYDTVSIATISVSNTGTVTCTTAGSTAKTLTATGILEFVAPAEGSPADPIAGMTFGVVATPA